MRIYYTDFSLFALTANIAVYLIYVGSPWGEQSAFYADVRGCAKEKFISCYHKNTQILIDIRLFQHAQVVMYLISTLLLKIIRRKR